MEMNLMMLAWVSSFLPDAQYQAILCCAGSHGYSAFKESLSAGAYPPNNTTLLLTNIQHMDDVGGATGVKVSAEGEDGEDGTPVVGSNVLHNTLTTTVASRSSSVVEVEHADDATTTTNPISQIPYSRLYSLTDEYNSYKHNRINVLDSVYDTVRENVILMKAASSLPPLQPRFVEKLMVIGNTTKMFPNEIFHFRNNIHQMEAIQEVDLTQLHGIRTLPLGFLSDLPNLKSINLSPLSKVKGIPLNFMRGCSSLKSIDLSPLSQVEIIQAGFLVECPSLSEVDMSPLISLKSTLPPGLFLNCTNLCSITLPTIGNRQPHTVTTNISSRTPSSPPTWRSSIFASTTTMGTTIDSDFLKGCSGLKNTLDLTPLINVVALGQNFMRGCSGLTEIDLSPLSNVGRFPIGFLTECSGLTFLDLSPFHCVRELPESFLGGCTGLASINISTLTKVGWISQGFLDGCCSLKAIDFTPFGNDVTELPAVFLVGCASLTQVDLSPFTHVTRINPMPEHFSPHPSTMKKHQQSPSFVRPGFMAGCTSLKSINLSSFGKIREIPENFLSGCCSLEEIDLTPLRTVKRINAGFLSHCSSLRSIDLSPLGSVHGPLPQAFLEGCEGLTTVDYSQMPHLAATTTTTQPSK